MKSVIAQQFQKKANIYVCFVLKQGEYSLRASDEWLKFGRVARDDVGKRKRKRLCEFAGLVLELFPPPPPPRPAAELQRTLVGTSPLYARSYRSVYTRTSTAVCSPSGPRSNWMACCSASEAPLVYAASGTRKVAVRCTPD